MNLYVAMHVFSTRVIGLSSFFWKSEMNFSAAIFFVTMVCIAVCFGEENKTVQKDSSEEEKEEGQKYVHGFPIQIVFRISKTKNIRWETRRSATLGPSATTLGFR